MMELVVSTLWGFSEATFFFFIPDIYLTRIALKNAVLAIKLCVTTAVAACIGGSILYYWASHQSTAAFNFLQFVPAIYPKLISDVVANLQPHPFYQLFIAPLKGIPYKIYAVAMGAQQISFWKFVIVSFIARLTRFILTTSIASFIAYYFKKYFSLRLLIYLHAVIWIMIYVFYFTMEYLYYA